MQINENVRLAEFTTFKIGGPARFFVQVQNEEDLKEAIDFAKTNGLKIFFLSGGSNVLLSDEGFEGLVILNKINKKIESKKTWLSKTKVRVDGGVSLKRFLEFLAMAELGGFENLYGIPGSVSGAVRGNAGAFGVEIKDRILSVRAFDIKSGKVFDLKRRQLNFGYRYSVFKENPDWFILSAEFVFKKGKKEEITTKMQNILSERERRQLQNIKSAGSFFKNPVAPKWVREEFEKEKGVLSRAKRVPAGWLIEKVGLKGAKFGPWVKVSNTSANYIINLGNAKAKDILRARDTIKKEVKKRFGIDLEEEVQIV